jgi:hypothetical protein
MKVGGRERAAAKTKGRICQGDVDGVNGRKMTRRTCRLTIQSKKWQLIPPNAGLGQIYVEGPFGLRCGWELRMGGEEVKRIGGCRNSCPYLVIII